MRVHLNISIDLDPVSGVMATTDSATETVQRILDERLGHYQPRVTPAPLQRPFVVTATYERHQDGDWGTATGQVPSFYLDGATQGILDNEGAVKIAHAVLAAGTRESDGVTFHVAAYEI